MRADVAVTLKEKTRRLLEHPVTEAVVAIAIVVSVVLVLMEAWLPEGSPTYWSVVRINDGLTIAFILELFLRFFAERRRERFARKYWYDILAVLPVLRGLRILRVLRLFRVGIIATRRLRKFSAAFHVVRVEYVIVGMTLLSLVLVGGLSLRLAEGSANADFASLEKTIWFSVLTLVAGEPIGGAPTTTLGQTVTLVMMLSGLTVFAIFTGTVSAVMVNVLKRVRLHDMELDELYDHIVICGWNQAGPLMLAELLRDEQFSHFVVVTQSDRVEQEEVIRAHPDRVLCLCGDYTRMETLQEAGIARAKSALLLADETLEDRPAQDRDARTVLAAMLIEKINSTIYTTVQLLNRENEASLREVGVEEIIVSEEYVGHVMATVTKSRGVVAMLDELLTSRYGHQFFRCRLPDELAGQTVAKALVHLKEEHNALLLAVDEKEGGSVEAIEVNPRAGRILEADCHIFIAASQPLP